MRSRTPHATSPAPLDASSGRGRVLATPAAEPPRDVLRPVVDGLLDVHVTAGAPAGHSHVTRRYARTPMRLLLPAPPQEDVLLAVVANTGGGIVGGDSLALDLRCGEGARVLVTGQAAEKVYRSAGATARYATRLAVDVGASLELLPQGTIYFDRSRLRRTTEVDVAAGGTLLAGELAILGRIARGEVWRSGYLHDAWRVRYDGRLAWADALHLDSTRASELSALNAVAGFGGGRALATLLLVAEDAASYLEAAREGLDDLPAGVRAGTSTFAHGLVARVLSAESGTVRAVLGRLWSVLRQAALGRPAALPRLWAI